MHQAMANSYKNIRCQRRGLYLFSLGLQVFWSFQIANRGSCSLEKSCLLLSPTSPNLLTPCSPPWSVVLHWRDDKVPVPLTLTFNRVFTVHSKNYRTKYFERKNDRRANERTPERAYNPTNKRTRAVRCMEGWMNTFYEDVQHKTGRRYHIKTLDARSGQISFLKTFDRQLIASWGAK